VASMIQALALDVAMIIFSVLALGLARKGLPASVERALIVVCALASAFMNWTASDHTSLRSVAVYVSAPILLALVTDRVISVVRRHVLGMPEDASVWARFGQRLGRAPLWAARLLVDFRATRTGIRHAILAATPLPELEERVAERGDLDVTAILREELTVGLERIRSAAEADLAKLANRLEDLAAIVTQVGQLGRDRAHEKRWGPRTADIDIIAFDNLTIAELGLTVPHPRLFERAFVLVPLAEIAPDRAIAGVRVRDALARLEAGGIERLPR